MSVILVIMSIILFYIAYKKEKEGRHAIQKYEESKKEFDKLQKNIDDEYEKLNEEKQKITNDQNELKDSKKELQYINQKIKELENRKKDLTNVINDLYDDSLLKTTNSDIIPNANEITSSEIKNKLSLLKIDQKNLIKDNKAVSLLTNISSKREKTTLERKILFLFNSETTGIINNLTIANINTIRNKIIKSFDKINKLFSNDNVEISKEYLQSKLDELELNYSFILKKQQEKEQQQAIKAQMLDEEKARRELEKKQKNIEKESKQFSNELNKVMLYLSKSTDDVQKQLYEDKIKELEAKIKDLNEEKEKVNNRIINNKAGFVYIISNIGSFGENIYKIGMTRRLDPMDRINELGSASVPFNFDVHATIFSNDAPALENHLHKVFADKAVNKVNKRKEFFNVSLNEIEKEVKDNFDATVNFTEVAKAEEYRRSLELSQN